MRVVGPSVDAEPAGVLLGVLAVRGEVVQACVFDTAQILRLRNLKPKNIGQETEKCIRTQAFTFGKSPLSYQRKRLLKTFNRQRQIISTEIGH